MSKTKMQLILWVLYIVFLGMYVKFKAVYLGVIAAALIIVICFQILKWFIPVKK
ncbi:MAG: hypothetical protein ACM3X7_13325 [Solirubrobacterales bacterium]